MIPAIWGAMKAATWAQRGITAGVVVGTISAVFAWGYIKGHSSSTTKQEAAMLDQALDVGKHEAAKAELLAQLEEKHDVQERQTEQAKQVVTHEIIKYVEVAKPTDLEPRYVDLVNTIRQLQRDAENRVSQTHAPATEIDEVRTYKITTNQLLLAYHELASARAKDLGMIGFCQEFETARHKGEMAFYEGLPATARADE